MKENIPATARCELRNNLITGAIAGGMLGLAFGYASGSPWLGLIVGIYLGWQSVIASAGYP